jgi:osmotically-inducible protein OsmY
LRDISKELQMSYPFNPRYRGGSSRTMGPGRSGSEDVGRGGYGENDEGNYGPDYGPDYSGHYGADPRELYHESQSGGGYGGGPGTTGYGGGGPGSERNSAYAGYDPRSGTSRYGMYGVREQPRGGERNQGGRGEQRGDFRGGSGGDRGRSYGAGQTYGSVERGYPGDPAYRGADFGEGRGGGASMRQQTGRRVGPKGYQRSDERIQEDVCERLAHSDRVDVQEVTVDVKAGVVNLGGTVHDRREKYAIETIVDDVFGVKEVQNSIRVQRDNGERT